MNSSESKIYLVKQKIEDDFTNRNEEYIQRFFDNFCNDEETRRFINYYNKTVLDKEKINFREFKRNWAIQGMKGEVCDDFNNNFEKLWKGEILEKKDIKQFFKEHCCKFRKEASFCSKLFHTTLPSEFPPLDNPIKKKFGLRKEDFIDSVLIIKEGYKLLIEKRPDLIAMIRKVLSNNKFSFLRVDELTNIRILDMYYWLRENKNA